MKNRICLMVLLLLPACASQPEDIAPQYVSALNYKDYDCDQLTGEAERVSRRVSELRGSLKKTADNDAAQMGVGLILFWPTLFFLEGGDGPQAQEYARLEGERSAIEKASVQKKCGIEFESVESKKTDDPNAGTASQ